MAIDIDILNFNNFILTGSSYRAMMLSKHDKRSLIFMKFILVMLMLLTGIGALSNVEGFHYFTDH